MKLFKKIFLGFSFTILPLSVLAMPQMPSGGRSSANVTYTSNSEISSDTTLDDVTYTSENDAENALLVSGGTSTLTNLTVTKSGDASGDEADFYGTNAGILVYNGAVLNINVGNITTNGSHANGVFAYNTGTINISNTIINTSSNNSGGIMVTGGGTLNASNLTITTLGNSSAAIRSDRGGGNLTVDGGNYETNGMGSPVIYSTANIVVKNASLKATASEGVVVEGANSVSLDNVNLVDTNNTLNGNSETYKNIFLYQSMSGDADEGVASFSAKDSEITTNQGDTIFVTNTTASITLENNTFINSNGDFIRIQSGKWGNSGSNGGNVTLNLINQSVNGNMVIDDISTLALSLTSGSIYRGVINGDNTAKSVDVTLASDTVMILEGDTYLTSLNNEVSDNSNIYANGYKLFVNGEEVSVNGEEYNTPQDKSDDIEVIEPTPVSEKSLKSDKKIIVYTSVISIACLLMAFVAKTFVSMRKKKD